MSCKETVIRGVHVFGAHLLHPKMLEVIAYGLEVGVGNNLNAIFISPHGPADRLGDYDRFTQTMSISIPGIVRRAANVAISKASASNFSLTAFCWQELIYTFFHELHHNIAYETSGDKVIKNDEEEEKWISQEEGEAHEYALEMVYDAIIRLKAEVPEMKEFTAFNEAIDVILNERIGEDDDWPEIHKERIDAGIVYECETKTYKSIVEYCLDTCEEPEKYDRENGGAAVALKVETPNLYDGGMPKEIGGDTGSTLAAVKHSLNERAQGAEGGTMQWDANMEPNPDGSITIISDPNGTSAQIMKEHGTTDEDLARGVRNYKQFVANGNSMTEPPWEASAEDIDNALDIDGQVVADETEGEEEVDLPSEVESTPSPAATGPTTLFAGATKADSAPTTPVAQPSPTQQAAAPATGITPKQQMIRNVMVKLVEHGLTATGFINGTFTNLDAIYNTPLELTPEERALGVFIGSKTLTNTGMGYSDVNKTGIITGFHYEKSKVPAYELLMNLGGQSCEVIRIVMQNPNKNSKSAARARAGERIGWIFHILDTAGPKQGETWEQYFKRSSKYIGGVINGEYVEVK